MPLSNNQTLELLTIASYHLNNGSTIVDGGNDVIKDIVIHKLSRNRLKERNCNNKFRIVTISNEGLTNVFIILGERMC